MPKLSLKSSEGTNEWNVSLRRRALTLSEEEVKWGAAADVSYDDDGGAMGGAPVNKDGCAFNPEEPTKPLENNNC